MHSVFLYYIYLNFLSEKLEHSTVVLPTFQHHYITVSCSGKRKAHHWLSKSDKWVTQPSCGRISVNLMNICQQSLRIICSQHYVILIWTVIIPSVMCMEVPWLPVGTLLIIQVSQFRSIPPHCHLHYWQSVKSISGSYLSQGNRALLIGPAAESCQSLRGRGQGVRVGVEGWGWWRERRGDHRDQLPHHNYQRLPMVCCKPLLQWLHLSRKSRVSLMYQWAMTFWTGYRYRYYWCRKCIVIVGWCFIFRVHNFLIASSGVSWTEICNLVVTIGEIGISL